MPELRAKANEAILNSQVLREEGRSLRFAAAVLASQLGLTILRSQRTVSEAGSLEPSPDQADP